MKFVGREGVVFGGREKEKNATRRRKARRKR